MKRVIGLLLAFGTASCSVSLSGDAALAAIAKRAGAKTVVTRRTAKPAAATINYQDLAPADEYFGPLKLSILGIRNTTSDAGKRYSFGIRDADSTVSTANFIDASVREWARRYPHDLEVARALYFLQRLYALVDSPAARSKAKTEASWMFGTYGKTPQAKQLKKILAAPSTPFIHPTAAPGANFVSPTAPPSDAAPDATTQPAPAVTPPSNATTPASAPPSGDDLAPSRGSDTVPPTPVATAPVAAPLAPSASTPFPTPITTSSPTSAPSSRSPHGAARGPASAPTAAPAPAGSATPIEPTASEIDGTPGVSTSPSPGGSSPSPASR